MKLFERFGDKGFHTSVATTFGIDFDAYESIVLARLRGAACRNNMVVSDGRMLTHALEGASELPLSAGHRYTVCPANAEGVFHPKLFIQFGRETARLIVGSANLTPSGLAGNLELVGQLRCERETSGEQRLIARAWQFARQFLDDRQESVRAQIELLERQTPWLESADHSTDLVPLADGSFATFLASGEALGIGTRFAELVDEPTSHLIVVSPYWDPELAALGNLYNHLSPSRISVLVDPKTTGFPKHAVASVPGLSIYDSKQFSGGRFIHAKAVIALTPSADHLLFGSANCTRAALGDGSTPGINEEACLYRRLPPGTVLDALAISSAFEVERILDPNELPELEFDETLPLNELSVRSPGQFECLGDTIIWHPRTGLETGGYSIRLLDERGLSIDCEIDEGASRKDGTVRFRFHEADRIPAFGQVLLPNEQMTSPAIVTHVDAIRSESRERRATSVHRRLDRLTGEGRINLELIDVLNELVRQEAEGASTSRRATSRSRTDNEDTESASGSSRVLTYEEFVRGRRPRNDALVGSQDSLAGSDISIVRSILNHIIGDNSPNTERRLDQDSFQGELDTGDDQQDPENLDTSPYPTSDKQIKDNDECDVRGEQDQIARQAKATRDQIARAFDAFVGQVQGVREQTSVSLTNFDLVKLRALLMLLCETASTRSSSEIAIEGDEPGLRVLPLEGDQTCWPRMIGRLLFQMFGGKNPGIGRLQCETERDQIPNDFIECWATCFWCIQACLQAPVSESERTTLRKFLAPLASRVLVKTIPSLSDPSKPAVNELLSDRVVSIMDRMSETYAIDLVLDSEAIRAGHRQLVEETFGTS